VAAGALTAIVVLMRKNRKNAEVAASMAPSTA